MQKFYGIIEKLRRAQIYYSPNRRFEVLHLAEKYLSEHYLDTNFDYSRLPVLSGLSYSYCKKLFIDKYGMPPVKYVTKLKIEHACELLQIQSYNISEVAALCGFENLYYFSNVFKKIKGISPKLYKEIN